VFTLEKKFNILLKEFLLTKQSNFKKEYLLKIIQKNSYSILAWLKRAIIQRRHGEQNQENISWIIQSLALDGLKPKNYLNPKNDDIDEWFT
tara:strand:+ start:530 stop:802 length:273 start_codon:yes stop_codon:yes gene_type:complete